MYYLYRTFRIKPSDRAKQILFANQMPEGSRLDALRKLSKLTDPVEQARAIIENKIPYRMAATVVAEMSPTIVLALVEVMSPQELINNIASLQKRGAFDNPDIKALIEQKLEQAKKSKKVAALKGDEALKVAKVDEQVVAAVKAVGDAQIKSKGRIKHPVALLVDKSASMNISIEVGKRIAAMLSAIAESDLFVYVFDTMPSQVKSQGKEMSHWEKAFAGVRAGGGTSCGIPLEMMRRQKQQVDQFVMVTDGGENNLPAFTTAYQSYCQDLGVTPSVVIVKVPGGDQDSLTPRLRAAAIEFETWTLKSEADYYSLPSLIPLISKSTKLDLLMEIMAWPLPKRKVS
jgi:hypothetical protein